VDVALGWPGVTGVRRGLLAHHHVIMYLMSRFGALTGGQSQPPRGAESSSLRDIRDEGTILGMFKGELIPLKPTSKLVPGRKRDSLAAWFSLYMGLEAGASAENTIEAKTRDLQAFLDYFVSTTGGDHPTSGRARSPGAW
jgi:hypothetical protein